MIKRCINLLNDIKPFLLNFIAPKFPSSAILYNENISLSNAHLAYGFIIALGSLVSSNIKPFLI